PVSNFNFGRPAIAALNALGIDAAAIGNHEFDWTVDTLRARMAEAHYRFLAANITDSAGNARPDWAEPFTVIERGGARVAVIGLALPATPQTTSPRNVRGLAFRDGAQAVRRVLPQARAAGDYVIVVAHVGGFCDGDGAAAPLAPATCHGEIIDLARGLDSGSVDLIVSGHTHSLVNTVVNGIPIVQARSSGAGIAVVDFVRVSGAGGCRNAVRGPDPARPRAGGRAALEPAVRLHDYRAAGGSIRGGAAAQGRRIRAGPAHRRRAAQCREGRRRPRQQRRHPRGSRGRARDVRRPVPRRAVSEPPHAPRGVRQSAETGAGARADGRRSGRPRRRDHGVVRRGQPRRPAHQKAAARERQGRGRRPDLHARGERLPRGRRQRLHDAPGRAGGRGGRHGPGRADPVPRGAAPADRRPGRPAFLSRGREPLIRVFVNERPVTVAPGASVRDAVEVLDRELADLVGRGVAYVTDGVYNA